MRIFTHMNVDLDAVASVWAAKKFIKEAKDAKILFRPANWDGKEMEKGDLAVDLDAGDKGLKGKKDADGTIHSCFETIVSRYASENDQKALRYLVRFIDLQDSRGSTVRELAPDMDLEDQLVLATTGINSVLRAFQAVNPRNDHIVLEWMEQVFNGMLKSGRSRARAEKEAQKKAKILPCGRVAVLQNANEYGTTGVLFSKYGIKVIVYVTGNDIGVIREGSFTDFRTDHPFIKGEVEDAGELDEWFAHPAGFLFCRGSRKAPAKTPSQVSPMKLAKAASVAMKFDEVLVTQ